MHTGIIICNLYATAGETKESGGKVLIIIRTTARANELITFIHNYFLWDEILDDGFCCSQSFFLVNYYVRYRIVTVFLLPRTGKKWRKETFFCNCKVALATKMLISIRSKSNLIFILSFYFQVNATINHGIVWWTARTSLMGFSFQHY